MSHHRSSSIRRRGTGNFSIGAEQPNQMRSGSFESDRSHRQSFHSFLKEEVTLQDDELEPEDVKTDVLFPRFTNTGGDRVDMDAFDRMVQDRTRKLSQGTIQLTKQPSRQNQLYRSSVTFDPPLNDIRFRAYSAQQNTLTSLYELLTEDGRQALASVVQSKGWWVDVLCPTTEEMRILSKTFRIHPLTTEDIQAQESREKIELFPNYTFVCFKAIDIDPLTDRIIPFNFYSLIFQDGLLTFHFKNSHHIDRVRERCDQLKEFMPITSDWMNYALIDSITDSFAPIILQVEMEAVSIDELSLVLKESEKADMLKRISRCRKQSTQLARLLTSKLDVIKSLMKRYEDKLEQHQQHQQTSFPLQLNQALAKATLTTPAAARLAPTHHIASGAATPLLFSASPSNPIMETKKAFSDVLLYLGDIQDHVVTMVQNINHYDRILHRAHTNYLAQVNLELTKTYNMTNEVMNRLTFMASVFIPLTLVCSLWGMNVAVPGQNYLDNAYFFWILGGMAVYCTGCLFFGKRVGFL
ncbi:hypothetical protein EDC96DRAFT_497420 [Choanephora cucurbitarum]|nr:hypothetical protein EDC96DRAFT_497420 [Choanephora cucurbitarum]